jgi:biopolymer transport protein ExbD
MATTPASSIEISDDDLQRMRYRKAKARKKRIEREAEGEIRELNITAMMDMMTIILVFLIKSYSASSITVTASEDVRPPLSTTKLIPKDTIAVTVTPKGILVGDKRRVDLTAGMKLKKEDTQGALILPLDVALKKEVEKSKQIESRGGMAFNHEVSIIGDRRIPYDLLSSVLYTAGQNELGNVRFVVIQKNAD